MSAPNMPLYDVCTPYGEEGNATDLSMDSAKSYAASLDSHGIPATIYYSRTVTHDEYMSR